MKRLLLGAVLALAATVCHAADVPRWLVNTEKAYPVSTYIRSVGEGGSAKAAREDALAAVSLYFEAKTQVLTNAIKASSAILVEDRTLYQNTQAYDQAVSVSSNAEFFCVHFTDPYYDKKRDTYSVLAYIEKAEASRVYESRISFLMQSIQGYCTAAEGETEPFSSITDLHKADVLSVLAKQYIQNKVTIVPQDSARYEGSLSLIAQIPERLRRHAAAMSFRVVDMANDERCAPLYNTVASVLERNGYAISLSDPMYYVLVDASFMEEQYAAGPFVRPSLSIAIVNAAGQGVYSYSKAYSRVGGASLENAYSRAVFKMQQDVGEHFLSD